MARAETEAQRILHAALEQAALLQVEMSKEVEEQTRPAPVDGRARDRRADGGRGSRGRRTRSAIRRHRGRDTAQRPHEADKIRDERDAAARAEDIRRARPSESGEVDALLDEAQQAALARVSEADAFAEERIAETAEWCKQHLAEADQIGTQRLLEAETRRTPSSNRPGPRRPPSPPPGRSGPAGGSSGFRRPGAAGDRATGCSIATGFGPAGSGPEQRPPAASSTGQDHSCRAAGRGVGDGSGSVAFLHCRAVHGRVHVDGARVP